MERMRAYAMAHRRPSQNVARAVVGRAALSLGSGGREPSSQKNILGETDADVQNRHGLLPCNSVPLLPDVQCSFRTQRTQWKPKWINHLAAILAVDPGRTPLA